MNSQSQKFHSLSLKGADADAIFLSWELSNICNQACSYCPDHLHIGDQAFPSQTDSILALLDEVQQHNPGKQLVIELAGGEPSLWLKLEEFLDACELRQIRVDLMSNGTRRPDWWRKFAPRFNMISLSFHWEFANAEHFREVISIVTPAKSLRVHILALPGRVTQSQELAQQWVQSYSPLTVVMKGIRPKFGNDWCDYSPEEWEILKKLRSFQSQDPHNRPGELEIRRTVFDESGRAYRARDLLYEGLNQFKGWDCAAGLLNFYITNDGNIFRGACRSGGPIGNLNSGWQLPKMKHRCEQNFCFCLPDLLLNKSKPADELRSTRTEHRFDMNELSTLG